MAALMAATLLSSCEEEEKAARDLTGVWETTDPIFTRTYKGATVKPTKTIFQCNSSDITLGDGIAVEYFDIPEYPVAYYNIKWETWTRNDGSAGIQVKYRETNDIFTTTNYKLTSSRFSGTADINGTDMSFNFVRGVAPDVSNVRYWGFNELMPTWHPVTYEGWLDVRRDYQGQTYQPTSVVITFDCDPVFNTSSNGFDMSYVRENYDDAPWGTYLADSVLDWRSTSDRQMFIYFANDGSSGSDYDFYNVAVNADSLVGDIFVDTNVFTHFNMKRVPNPDWSTITEWGINNRQQ